MNKRKAPLFKWEYFIYDQVKVLSALPTMLFWRPRWVYENKEAKAFHRGPFLLIANHTTFIDPIYIQLGVWYRRHHMLAAKEVMGTGIRNWFFRHCLCINVDRENFDLAKMREIVSHLNKGEMITVFPGGHISKGEESGLEGYKQGVILMAMQAGVPIVPVYIATRSNIFKRLGFCIGAPLTVEQLTGSRMPSMVQIQEAGKKLFEKEQELKFIYEGELKK